MKKSDIVLSGSLLAAAITLVVLFWNWPKNESNLKPPIIHPQFTLEFLTPTNTFPNATIIAKSGSNRIYIFSDKGISVFEPAPSPDLLDIITHYGSDPSTEASVIATKGTVGLEIAGNALLAVLQSGEIIALTLNTGEILTIFKGKDYTPIDLVTIGNSIYIIDNDLGNLYRMVQRTDNE